jgi:hypothetical protein
VSHSLSPIPSVTIPPLHNTTMHISASSLPRFDPGSFPSGISRSRSSVPHAPNGLASLHPLELAPLLPISVSRSQTETITEQKRLFFSTSKLDALRQDKARVAGLVSSAEIRATPPRSPLRPFVTDDTRRMMSADNRRVSLFDRCPTPQDLRAISRISRQVKETTKRLTTPVLPEGGVYPIHSMLPLEEPHS